MNVVELRDNLTEIIEANKKRGSASRNFNPTEIITGYGDGKIHVRPILWVRDCMDETVKITVNWTDMKGRRRRMGRPYDNGF